MNKARIVLLTGIAPTILLGAIATGISQPPPPPTLISTPNDAGAVGTLTLAPSFNMQSSFFKPLGNNDRSCGSCHVIGQAMSISVAGIDQRFNGSQGEDPLFRTVDGSDSPLDPTVTLSQRIAAYSELNTKGVIRVSLPVLSTAQYTLSAVQEPYGYADSEHLSLFRRPLPTANLRFQSSVMWDGRESPTAPATQQDFLQQASDAVTTHEQGSAPNTAILEAIFNFEAPIYTAQISDTIAGPLNVGGAQGGPSFLINQPWFPGINDNFGRNPQGQPFNPNVFTIYNAWSNLRPDGTPGTAARMSIARGQSIFNTFKFNITGVAGLNDVFGKPTISASCSFCHNSPNVGTRSLPDLMHTGIGDAAFRTPDQPLYTFKNKVTAQTVQLTDPGQGLITGKWADLGKFKVPSLRGLEGRSPYMHNGSLNSVEEIVNFYNARFSMNLNPQQKADLGAFLQAL